MYLWFQFKRSLAFLPAIALVFALYACGGGSAAPGGMPGGPVTVGGGLGGVNQAMPGMDEVPLGPKVDVNDIFAQLKCQAIPHFSSQLEDSESSLPEPITYRLKIKLSPWEEGVLRLIDKTKNQYRQVSVADEGTFSIKWEAASELALQIPPKNVETSDEFKACPTPNCHFDLSFPPNICLADNSCRAYGWDAPPCVVLNVPDEIYVPDQLPGH